jgi:hypothetical protein
VKTDVIFLGAGASLSAGFPTNKDLTNYIIYQMSPNQRFTSSGQTKTSFDQKLAQQIQSDKWPKLKERLRRSGFLSVDEFCQLAKEKPEMVLDMKRMLRVALFDHTRGWFQNNDYRTFVESLFVKPASTELNPRFTVVNFNYDGLLGKLLTDSVIERCLVAGKNPPSDQKLAGWAGGYYVSTEAAKFMLATESDGVEQDEFAHHMLHGTFVAVREGKYVYSLSNAIYARDGSDGVDEFSQHYSFEPLIHFPWELDERGDLYKRQYAHATESVRQAKRIHFIGISGHPLLTSSLMRICGAFHPHELQSKDWHIATPDDKKQTFHRILECIFGQAQCQRADFTMYRTEFLRQTRLFEYNNFEHWLRESPHLKP